MCPGVCSAMEGGPASLIGPSYSISRGRNQCVRSTRADMLTRHWLSDVNGSRQRRMEYNRRDSLRTPIHSPHGGASAFKHRECVDEAVGSLLHLAPLAGGERTGVRGCRGSRGGAGLRAARTPRCSCPCSCRRHDSRRSALVRSQSRRWHPDERSTHRDPGRIPRRCDRRPPACPRRALDDSA